MKVFESKNVCSNRSPKKPPTKNKDANQRQKLLRKIHVKFPKIACVKGGQAEKLCEMFPKKTQGEFAQRTKQGDVDKKEDIKAKTCKNAFKDNLHKMRLTARLQKGGTNVYIENPKDLEAKEKDIIFFPQTLQLMACLFSKSLQWKNTIKNKNLHAKLVWGKNTHKCYIENFWVKNYDTLEQKTT